MKPKGTPAFGFSARGGSDFVGKDLVEGNLEPIQKSLIQTASSYLFDSVANLTECRFNGIRIERDKFPFAKPTSKEGSNGANEIINVSAGFWVLQGIQSLLELLKPFVGSMKDGLHSNDPQDEVAPVDFS